MGVDSVETPALSPLQEPIPEGEGFRGGGDPGEEGVGGKEGLHNGRRLSQGGEAAEGCGEVEDFQAVASEVFAVVTPEVRGIFRVGDDGHPSPLTDLLHRLRRVGGKAVGGQRGGEKDG